jgi:integrase
MPKRAALEPRKTKKEHAPWVVNLPPSLSGTGKRERRYFDTRREGATFCSQQRIRLENYGTASANLPVGKVEEAIAAFEKLEGTGVTLIAAVEHYLTWRRSRESSITFHHLFEAFAGAKADRSEAYRIALRYTLPRFPGLHDKVAVEITADDIQREMEGMTDSVRNAFIRILRAVFNYGIRRGWCEVNPIRHLDIGKIKFRKEILTNAQATALLRVTLESDLELLPYQLFCLFAGIRPKEVERLAWSQINFEEAYVEVPEETAKTGIRRIVEMEPLLVRWLDFYVGAGGRVTGLIVPKKNLRKRLRALRAAAGFQRWPQDAPRRTYASCWLAAYADVNRLNNLMGHTSPAMLWRHYHKAVTQRQAASFWKIEPPKSRGKIVSFAA